MQKHPHYLRLAAGLLLFCPWAVWADTATPPAKVSEATPAEAAPAVAAGPDYVRMAEDDKSNRLEVSIATFTLPDGRIVDLFGVVHLADAAYYQDVNQRLGTYDAVLFELLGDPAALQNPAAPDPTVPAPRPHPLRGLQQGIGNVFKLSFQLEQIDYTRPNFVHADASTEEFSKMQADRGESMMKLLMKSFELSNDPAFKDKIGDAGELGLADLVMLFYSQKSMLRIKGIFAKLLAESEQLMAGGLLEKDNAIIDGRNDVALKKLNEVLTDPAKKRVAIFYGAGHMPSMEAALHERLKAKRTGETWLAAWTMPLAVKPKLKP
jgi:hypothetical protein